MQVWVQLAEMYGKAMYRDHGKEPPTLWLEAFDRLTDNEIWRSSSNFFSPAGRIM